MPRPRLALLAIAALLVLSGCTDAAPAPAPAAAPTEDEPRILQGGAPGEPSRELTAEEVASIELPVHTEADVDFMRAMIPHHRQALEMTALVPDRAGRDDLALFAERMSLSQDDEIAQIERWLEARGEAVTDGEHAHHGDDVTHGMATEAELAELAAAEGEAFDRLFLTLMQRHHEGALQMVAELFAADGGQEPEAFAFATHVDGDQRIELSRIAQMLAELDG
jgi:uncharacterized protein (DUF305 family)